MKRQTIWILGGGKFGRMAAEKLHKKLSDSQIIVIEKDPTTCRQLEGQPFETVCTDGISFLAEKLQSADFPQWIVPVIPLHVAYEWMRLQLSERFEIQPLEVPDNVAKLLPNPIRGSNGELYISNADFVCPKNCAEPSKLCTFTGKPRPAIMHQALVDLRIDGFESVAIRSRQLTPGVGGYRPADLLDALEQAEKAFRPVLLSSACKCHGVVNAFFLKRADDTYSGQ